MFDETKKSQSAFTSVTRTPISWQAKTKTEETKPTTALTSRFQPWQYLLVPLGRDPNPQTTNLPHRPCQNLGEYKSARRAMVYRFAHSWFEVENQNKRN